MAIPGENSVPLGVAGSGSAFLLPSREPNALAILQQGERARALARDRQAARQLKIDQDNAKQFNDFVKFDQDGSPYFADELNKRVYQPLMGQVTTEFKNHKEDLFARNAAVAPIMQRGKNETKQSEAKTKYINDQLRAIQADGKLFDSDFAAQNLSGALRNEDGTGRLPSEMDAEAWHSALLGDHRLYKEPEVVRRATEKLMPVISQRVEEAGTIGGQHTAAQVRGRLIATDGNGHPIMVRDRNTNQLVPQIKLTADTQELLEGDPTFKLKVDAREKAYNEKRAADPSLPQMSRRGHIAQMVGPLAFYDERHDEGLNRLPPQPQSSAAKDKGFVPDDGQLVEGEYSASIPGAAPAYVGLRDDKGQAVGYDFSRANTPQSGFQHLGQGKQPILKTASGDLKEKHTDAIKVKNYYTEDGSGNFSEVTNNVTPQAGVFGPSTVVAVDVTTNKPLFGKSRDEQKQLIASGRARPQLFIDLAADKNEKFAADKSQVLKDLTIANVRSKDKKSPAELEDQATKIVSKGVTRHLIPYDAQNAQVINQVTGGHYKAALRTMLATYKSGAPIPAATPKKPAPPRPSFLQAKPAPAKAATKPTTRPADLSGGMLD